MEVLNGKSPDDVDVNKLENFRDVSEVDEILKAAGAMSLGKMQYWLSQCRVATSWKVVDFCCCPGKSLKVSGSFTRV